MKYSVIVFTAILLTVPFCLASNYLEISDPVLLGKLELPVQCRGETYQSKIVLVCSKGSETVFHEINLHTFANKYWHLHEMKIDQDVWMVTARTTTGHLFPRIERYFYYFADHEPEKKEYQAIIMEWADTE